MTVCDLCDKEIPEGQPDEGGSLTEGYIAHSVKAPKTRHAWLLWPPPSRKRNRRADQEPEQYRRYDFHAECILRLVESAAVTR